MFKNCISIKIDECSSTMDLGVEYVKTQLPKEPYLILANTQTAGRGRLGRAWESPKGNLYATMVLPLCSEFNLETSHIPFIGMIALGKVLWEIGIKEKLKYKWPNDLLIEGRKAGGILVEIIKQSNHIYGLMGIGLNISKAPHNLPAICLRDLGHQIAPSLIIDAFIIRFFDYCEKYREFGFGYIKTKWLKHSYKLGERLYFQSPNRTYDGIFEGITEEGALILSLESGKTNTLHSGDVLLGNL